jgi:hypothetical protein
MSTRSATLQSHGSSKDMRRLAISAIPVLILLVTASSSAAHDHGTSAPPCPPANSRVLLADAEAEVYVVKEHLSPYTEPEPVVRGCARGQKRSYFIGEAKEHPGGSGGGGSSSVKLEMLAGAVVAYTPAGEYGGNRKERAGALIVVRNLRTGRVLHKVTASMLAKLNAGPDSVGPIEAIVVKNDGAVAWIVGTGYPDDIEYDVYALDKSGSRLLASGADIVPYSLALAANTLYWTQGGEPATASLN